MLTNLAQPLGFNFDLVIGELFMSCLILFKSFFWLNRAYNLAVHTFPKIVLKTILGSSNLSKQTDVCLVKKLTDG